MKRINEFYNADFNPCLFNEAWKVIIFHSGEMDPESAVNLGMTSSFFYDLICHSNQKETRDEQQLFWKNHVIEVFGENEEDAEPLDWKNRYGISLVEHNKKLTKIYNKILDFEVMVSEQFSDLKSMLDDLNNQCQTQNNLLGDINNQLDEINNMLSEF